MTIWQTQQTQSLAISEDYCKRTLQWSLQKLMILTSASYNSPFIADDWKTQLFVLECTYPIDCETPLSISQNNIKDARSNFLEWKFLFK